MVQIAPTWRLGCVMRYRWTAKRKHEAELEVIFNLSGVDLERKRWCGRYWYDGAPDYAERDCEAAACAAGGDSLELRTALERRLFGADKPPRGWVEVASFRSSGEADCWCDGDESCRVCDGDGFIYIGDGWCEVVYSRKA